jgi:hypothetical protein
MEIKQHFTDAELACKCGCGMGLDRNFRKLLEEIRTEFGKPMAISSGARCTVHNRKIGGARGSAHTLGKAADIKALKDSDYRRDLLTFLTARLDKYNLWMEDPAFTPSWIHIDCKVRLGTPRIFKP